MMVEQLIVLYAKAVDDKDNGIYLDNIYFGGVAEDQPRADQIATECVNSVRGGTAIVRIMQVESGNSILEIFREARLRFDRVEREMIETEDILQANNSRAKRRRK